MKIPTWVKNWINWTSFLVIVGSLVVWYYFLPNFFGQDGQASTPIGVKVEGVKTIDSNEVNLENKSPNNVTSGKLFPVQPDAPVRREETGDTYVRAKSAIAIDADTGTVLHYQNGNARTAIASLTKVMSAIIVVESIDDLEKEVIIIDEEAFYTDGTKVGCPRSGYCVSNRLRMGEKVSAKVLFEAMVMNSANDAAVALAKHVAGTQKEFARMMNQKAEALGLTDTHFCNPSGLDEDDNPGGCYSTAHDLARITAYSLQHDKIWQAMKIQEKEVYSVDGTIMHQLVNTDLLLDQMPNCLGGKTGFTYEAGKSLMTAAHHPLDRDRKVVAVMIDNIYRWQDMQGLFNWVFNAYRWP